MPNKQYTSNDQRLLEDIMRHRRDDRGNNFLDTDVSNIVVKNILQAATLAPSVGFSQPWEFVVIRCNKTKNQVADSFKLENQKAEKNLAAKNKKRIIRLKLEGILEAPVNIAVFYKPSVAPVLGQNSTPEMGEYSVICAVQNM